MSGPLDGVRVLEVASYVFVPAAAAVLADWGADVLKVEHPDQRRSRSYDSGVGRAGVGERGLAHLRGRPTAASGRSDSTSPRPEGKEILLSLVDEADVFLTNLLPGARRKLGIEPEDIMGRNPRVIYGRGTAQGPRGALAGRGGFDGITYWGRSGAAIGATTPGQEFPSPMPGPGFGDMQSGMALAGGISRRPVRARADRSRRARRLLADVGRDSGPCR